MSGAIDPAAVVIEAFRTVLRRDNLNPADNFFRMGGNSLGMVKVIALLRRRGLRTTPRQFMTDPTVSGVAGAATPAPPATG